MTEQTTSMDLAPGSLKTWFLEIRGPFLALSVVLAPIGTAIAWHDGSLNLGHFLLAWAGAILAHVGVNVFNEYFDYVSGLDFETQKTPFSGGSGMLTAGLIKPRRAYLLGVACLFIDAVIGENPEPVESYRRGKTKALAFLVGQVMEATRGKANPQLVNEMLREKLG